MGFFGNILLNMESIILLTIIFAQAAKHPDRSSLLNKLFSIVLLATISLLVADIFSRFDGKPETLLFPVLNRTGNFLVFLFGPVIACCWMLYVHLQVFHDEKRTLRLIRPMAAIFSVHAILTVLMQFYGWYYTIDANNIYRRRPLFALPVIVVAGFLVSAYAMLIKNRKNIEKKYFLTMLLFSLPPAICIPLQILFYGSSLMLNSIVLSLLIVYINIQNNYLYADYLTGVNNRKKLELHLKERIEASSAEESFSAILIDLDDFKAINDTFGHHVGDEALATAAQILKGCLRSNDFIARFGGDEFFVILDISQLSDLEAAVRRIDQSFDKYNENSGKPYRINASMGFAVYDCHSQMKSEEFEKSIDSLMYQRKRALKSISLASFSS